MIVTFWLIVSVMMLVTLGLLLRPLLRHTATDRVSGEAPPLPVYRQQLAELEQDFRNGVLTNEQYQQARQELERRVLEETADPITTQGAAGWRLNPKVTAAVLAILVPSLSTLLYFKLGAPVAITHPQLSSMTAQNRDTNQGAAATLDALAERLKQRLEQNPNDGVGWALLARTYVELGRHAEAVPIYEKAKTLIPNDAQLLADYADALGVVHGRKLDGRPELLIQEALRADPTNVKALMLAGTVAFDRKEYKRAADYWTQAREGLPPDTDRDVIQELSNGIAEAEELSGTKAVRTAGTKPSRQMPSPNATRAISGTVRIAPELSGGGAPTDTLFVFARELNGPPMPVSIIRASRKDLPFRFRLDDSTSPMPSRKLSDVGPVVVIARLSKSGNAMPQSGDWQGTSQPVKSGTDSLTLVIDSQIP